MSWNIPAFAALPPVKDQDAKDCFSSRCRLPLCLIAQNRWQRSRKVGGACLLETRGGNPSSYGDLKNPSGEGPWIVNLMAIRRRPYSPPSHCRGLGVASKGAIVGAVGGAKFQGRAWLTRPGQSARKRVQRWRQETGVLQARGIQWANADYRPTNRWTRPELLFCFVSHGNDHTIASGVLGFIKSSVGRSDQTCRRQIG